MAILRDGYRAVRRGRPKHHLGYRGEFRNVDQVGHQLKLQEQTVCNKTAPGSTPNTAGATLAPTGYTLCDTACPFDREELCPTDA